MADTPRREKRGPWWLLLLGIAILAGYLAVEWHLISGLGFPLDDSWIHLQFARNLAAGEGLTYQGGEWMPASTAPLWTALLALVFALPGSPVLWAKLLGGFFYLATGLAVFRLARRAALEPPLAALTAAMFYSSSWMAWSALSGMEIPLFCWLTVTGAGCHLEERRMRREGAPDGGRPWSFLLFGLAVLARPEGILLLLAAVADRVLLWRRGGDGQGLALCRPSSGSVRAEGRGLAVVAAVLLPTLLLFWWLGDSPLPTTYGAKAGSSAGWGIQRRYLLTVLTILFKPQPILVLLAGGGALLTVGRLGGRRDVGLLLPVWAVGLPLGYALLSPAQGSPLVGNFGRYMFPVLPFVIVLGMVALEPAWQRLRRGRALLVLVLVVPTFLDLVQTSTLYGRNVANIHDGDVRIAHWLRDEVPADAVVAVQDIGAIGYLAPQRLVDLSALISPRLRDLVAAEGLAGVWRFLEEERPDLVVVFPQWAPPLTSDPQRLRLVLRLDVPDNITLGGDSILVYSTPWGRYWDRYPPPL